mmetsp:Transcript_33090/g.55458  ORF Transcript_33090/g.55458 Transcript_33090/m.55458 type:complete len:244 (-) Transcript_33090:807-1538(-)
MMVVVVMISVMFVVRSASIVAGMRRIGIIVPTARRISIRIVGIRRRFRVRVRRRVSVVGRTIVVVSMVRRMSMRRVVTVKASFERTISIVWIVTVMRRRWRSVVRSIRSRRMRRRMRRMGRIVIRIKGGFQHQRWTRSVGRGISKIVPRSLSHCVGSVGASHSVSSNARRGSGRMPPCSAHGRCWWVLVPRMMRVTTAAALGCHGRMMGRSMVKMVLMVRRDHVDIFGTPSARRRVLDMRTVM